MMNAHSSSSIGKIQGRWQWRIFGFAMGVFLAFLIAPNTGWLVRQQLLAPIAPWVTPGSPLFSNYIKSPPSERSERPWRQGAQALSGDVAVQAAYALHTNVSIYHDADENAKGIVLDEIGNTPQDRDARVAARFSAYTRDLQAIIERFPANPLPYALYLRYSVQSDIHIIRPELRTFQTGAGLYRPPDPLGAWINRPQELIDYERIGHVGERLDSQNAYFPMMLAIGHLADHRDKEALADLDRASRKLHWNDFLAEEIQGVWRLNDRAYGKQSAQVRLNSVLGQARSHNEALQHVFEMFVMQAMLQESTGHPEAGVALRCRLMRVAHTMCLAQNNYPDIANASRLLHLSCKYVKGKKLSSTPNETTEEYYTRLETEYARYLDSLHAWKESSYFQMVCQECHRKTQLSPEEDPYGYNLLEAEQHSWIVGLMLCSEVFLISLLASITAITDYRNRFRPLPMRPLPRGVGWGIAGGFAVFLATGITAFVLMQNALPGTLALCLPLLAILTLGCLNHFLPETRRLLATTLITTLSLSGLLVTLLGLTNGAQLYMATTYSLYTDRTNSGNIVFSLSLLLSGIALILPAVLVYMVAVTARIRHQPLAEGGLYAFRKMALPLLALLLLVYVGYVTHVSRQEDQITSMLDQRISTK